MLSTPKILLMILLGFVVWYAIRWFDRLPPRAVRQRDAPAPQPQAAIEDLVACRSCGAYVVASARGCGKTGCPQPL